MRTRDAVNVMRTRGERSGPVVLGADRLMLTVGSGMQQVAHLATSGVIETGFQIPVRERLIPVAGDLGAYVPTSRLADMAIEASKNQDEQRSD